ncbi:MAG: glycosyltransferase family 39 protein [Elusimicrobia bacterium]|nr:glycosyltransferase family 39 protein [Elusimicrobiota bacterium]
MRAVDGLLVSGYPAMLLAMLGAWAAALAANAKEFRPHARSAALLFAGALLIRLFLVPAAHQVYFDEFEHFNIAENLARLGRFAESLAGGRPDLDVLEVPTWPGLYHVLLALCLRVRPSGETAPFILNAVLSSLSVAALYAASMLLLGDALAALLAALVWAVSPLHLQFSVSGDLTACSLLWIAVSFAALGVHLRRSSRDSYLLLLASLALAANARFENMLLAPVFAAALTRSGRKWRPNDGLARLAEAAFAALLAAPLLLAARNRHNGLAGFDASLAATVGSLWSNAAGNAWFLLRTPEAGPWLLCAGALAWRSRRRPGPAGLALALAGAAYFVAYSAFFRGEFGFRSEGR